VILPARQLKKTEKTVKKSKMTPKQSREISKLEISSNDCSFTTRPLSSKAAINLSASLERLLRLNDSREASGILKDVK